MGEADYTTESKKLQEKLSKYSVAINCKRFILQLFRFPLFDCTFFFIKSRTDEHYLFSTGLVLCGVLLFMYLLDGIFRTTVAAQLKLENVYRIGCLHYTVGASCRTMYFRLHELSHQRKDKVHCCLVVLLP